MFEYDLLIIANKIKSKYLLLFLALFLSRCTNNKGEPKLTVYASVNKSSIKYLSQDSLTSFLYQCKTINANKRAKNPFNKLKYDKVIAYDYDGANGEHTFNIVEDKKLVLKIRKQRQLSQKQVDDLTNLLGSVSTYGDTFAMCFEPHFGVVFYYNNKIAAYISIAIGCNRLESSVPIPATSAKFIRIGDDYKYPAEGFSKIGSQRLISLSRDLKFRIL